jgi:hypothetical protein
MTHSLIRFFVAAAAEFNGVEHGLMFMILSSFYGDGGSRD